MADSDRELVAIATIQAVGRAVERLIRSGGWVLIAYFLASYGYLAIHDLAGQVTLADIFVVAKGTLGEKTTSSIQNTLMLLAIVLVGCCGVMYGWHQRKLRRAKTEYLQGRIVTLERALDAHRSSSMLTPTGETRPEDRG